MDALRRNAGTTRNNVRCALVVFTVALLALALFRSESFVTYALDLPQNAVGRRMVVVAEGWNRWMNALGTARVTRFADAAMERLSTGESYDDDPAMDDMDDPVDMDDDLPAGDLPADDLPADDLPEGDLPGDDLPADGLPGDGLPSGAEDEAPMDGLPGDDGQ